MDYLKFKLKFDLRSYFFYFNLSLFKTLTSNSLFLTLFHLNIHYFFFYYFLNSQNTFLSIFLFDLPLFRCISPSSFFFFPITHKPLLFSFLFFFSHHSRTLFLSFYFSPTAISSTETQQLQQKKNSANLQTFTEILQKIIANLQTFTAILQKISKPDQHIKAKSHKPSPSLIWRRRRTSKRSRGRRRKRRERETVATRVGSIALTATEQTK